MVSITFTIKKKSGSVIAITPRPFVSETVAKIFADAAAMNYALLEPGVSVSYEMKKETARIVN